MSNLRKQTLVIAVLIALIACAGYFANKFNENTKDTNALNIKTNTSKTTTNYFVEGRLGRDNARSALKQECEKIASSETSTKEAKTAAAANLMELLNRGDKENAIETKAKERGFEDALCLIGDKGIELCVKTAEPLTNEQAAQLSDDIVKTTGISPSNITIKEKQ